VVSGDGSTEEHLPRRAPGSLQAQVRAVLQAAEVALSPGEVGEALAAASGQQERLSYSTVVTVLSRLHAKGMVTRARSGRAFRYTAAKPAEVGARRMRHVLDAQPDRDAVLTRFVSTLGGRDEELLRQLLSPASAHPGGATGPAEVGPAGDVHSAGDGAGARRRNRG